jgi:uroporphyrinogen decarboxylase
MTSPLVQTLLQKNASQQPPVWIMRQAGRYLPEYLKVRAEAGSFMNLCRNPALAAEVTLQPLRRFNLDAAIIFSDILMIPYGLGQHVTFVEGEGPKLSRLDHPNDFHFLKPLKTAQALQPVYDALALVKENLPENKSLIGFAGAPWTVATYMIEGGSSRTFEKTKAFVAAFPEGMQTLMDILVEATAAHLLAQIQAGADVMQLFDSWAGALTGDDFARWVIAPNKAIIARVKQAAPHVPVIGFPRKARGADLTNYCVQTGIDGVGIDEDLSPAEACALVPPSITLQGNVSPQVLVAGGAALEQAIDACLEGFKGRSHIFNLGHGVVPQTPPDNVAALVARVRFC